MSTLKTTREQTQNFYNSYLRSQQKEQEECTHTYEDDAKSIFIHDYNEYIAGKKDFPRSVMVCSRCRAIYEGNTYDKGTTESMLFNMGSILEQIKIFASLEENDREFLRKAYDALHVFEKVVNFYNNLVDKLSNNDGGKKKNKNYQNSGVRIGVNRNSFNRTY